LYNNVLHSKETLPDFQLAIAPPRDCATKAQRDFDRISGPLQACEPVMPGIQADHLLYQRQEKNNIIQLA
jgi:hypothetical protein